MRSSSSRAAEAQWVHRGILPVPIDVFFWAMSDQRVALARSWLVTTLQTAAKPRRGRPPKADKAAPDEAQPPKPRDKVSQGGVRQQASIPVVLACCVSPPNSGRRSINLRRRFTVKLTTQELEQMRSVDIGAVAAESLPDVSGMTFDNALSRKERISRFLQTVKNPYCFCIGGVGVKIEFAESGPSLQDKLTDFLLRQRSGL